MLRAPAEQAVEMDRRSDQRPYGSPIGLKILVPGASQVAWGQRARGAILGASFAFALLAAFWAWGTWLGWGILAFAFLAHVSAAIDVLRQASFPFHSRRTALTCVTAALGLLVYLPLLSLLSLVAWPGFDPDGSGSGYLVNCWAYRSASPSQGQWIWMRLPQFGEARAAQIVAVAGQEVEWTGRVWQVDGEAQHLHPRLRFHASPQRCRFKVPAKWVLVEPDDDGVSPQLIGPVVLVSADQIVGRAWAQYYPIWERRLL
jgi:hypothetical protein